jgi:hypothetical protein
MNPWRWVRARRWWVQLIFAAVLLPIALVLAYVGARTVQFFAAERDPGVYVPAGANVVVRARGLESHLRRIRGTTAWRALDRRVLHDAVLRRTLNGLLKENGAPTLDDLDDDRKPFAKVQARVLDVIGEDLIASLRVRDSVPKAPFCAILRLRWLYYLAAPFAGLALPTETIDGQSVVVLRDGAQEIRVAFVGGLAIAASDKALLQDALRRRGREEEPDRPIAGRVAFEGSPGLLSLRKSLQDSGVLASVKWETARGLSFSAELRESVAALDLQIDGAEPVHPDAPPVALRAWAPLSTSGVLLTNTGGADLMAWLASLVAGSSSRDASTQALRDTLKELEDGGLKSALLPQLRDGMAVVTGVAEREGRSYSTFVLLLPTRDAAAAVEAMNGMVRKIAGSYGDSKYFSSTRVGDVTLNSWSWPEGLQINDLLSPTYGAMKDVLVLGNNAAFTAQVVETAASGAGFEETSEYRKLRKRMKEEGFGGDPALAGGFVFPPLVEASLDGSLYLVAKQIVYAYERTHAAQIRAEVEEDLRRQGGLSEPEINKAYYETIKRMVAEQEVALRRDLEPLNAVRWAAFEAQAGDRGIRVRAALELR